MAPSLFTLSSLVFLSLIFVGLLYLCLYVKSKKFCGTIPFFICGLFTLIIQLLLELNKSPAQAIILSKLQFVGFWYYFITVPILTNAFADGSLKRTLLTAFIIITVLVSILTLKTELIVTSQPFLFKNHYLARMGTWNLFISIPLFALCFYYCSKLLNFVNKLHEAGISLIILLGSGVSMVCGMLDYIGKLNGTPLFPWSKDAFSIGMLAISITFGILIFHIYSQILYEYRQTIQQLENLFKKNKQLFDEFVQLIAKTIDAKDKYTAGHSMRVAEYATMIASALNLPDEQIEILQKACLFHDIGKMGIPDGVLNKKSPLNEQDRIYIYRHPILAREILSNMSEFRDLIDVIYHHHERYDGNGYPRGLKGEEIPLLARILAVADAYDAMLSERPYRNARTKIEAIKELIAEKGRQFDPMIVDTFIKIIIPEVDRSLSNYLTN